ncbi:unnamed protein product [Ilex paraguariensis]|uniref:BURP domain-containing protein n=1 Tax=Ilex paraguariensis TaxID=185542 RepID=A0ABC8UP10_9AQUA
MVDFSTSKLRKRVEAMSTVVERETQLQKYSISGRVWQCYTGTRLNVAYPQGADGIKAKAVAVCHTDTSAWNPKHLAFQVLKVNQGTVPICHFLPEDHIVWVPN